MASIKDITIEIKDEERQVKIHFNDIGYYNSEKERPRLVKEVSELTKKIWKDCFDGKEKPKSVIEKPQNAIEELEV